MRLYVFADAAQLFFFLSTRSQFKHHSPSQRSADLFFDDC